MRTVLHVEGDASYRDFVARRFRRKGVRFVGAATAREGLRAAEADKPDLVLLDVRLPASDAPAGAAEPLEKADRTGLELLHALRNEHPEMAVALLSGLKVGRVALGAVRAGALDYFNKSHPADLERLEHVLDALCAGRPLCRPARSVREGAVRSPRPQGSSELVGSSPSMQRVRALVARYAMAPRKCPVMILGETGTGKDLAAQSLHARSGCSGQLVRVNCAAISHGLFESELFGHEAGSFTGATAQRLGALELAAGGTLFLDEVGELPPNQQAKLLSCLEYPFLRVGGRHRVEFTGRLVVATNRDLRSRVRGGEFRQDLYHRIAGATLELPPLRERREDIAELATVLLDSTLPDLFVGSSALRQLEQHSWPGNVRELHRVLLGAMSVDNDGVIGTDDLPPLVDVGADDRGAEAAALILDLPTSGSKVRFASRLVALSAMKRWGSESRAAKALEIDRKTLSRILHPTPKSAGQMDS
ncbi:MAG: sigma-54 dependent transcriptional regulator [Polyangiaceae bacterium]